MKPLDLLRPVDRAADQLDGRPDLLRRRQQPVLTQPRPPMRQIAETRAQVLSSLSIDLTATKKAVVARRIRQLGPPA
jgi:hypothetical protein